MGQYERVVYHNDSHRVNRIGECTIDISSEPVEDSCVPYR